jgi:hypothetical protein
LWRFSPRRLDVEAWRDAILEVAGRLDRTVGGPSSSLAEPDHVRRTVYGIVSRREPDKMMIAFDFPDANVSSERRSLTTTPQQQLFVLNSQFMLQSAKAMCLRLERAAADDKQRIVLAYRWALARPPTPGELQAAVSFLHTVEEDSGEDQAGAWKQLTQALLASSEFAWID